MDVSIDGTNLDDVKADVRVGMKDLLGESRRENACAVMPPAVLMPHSPQDRRIGIREFPHVREHYLTAWVIARMEDDSHS